MLEESSFRDPSGQVYIENGKYRRQVNESYLETYRALMLTGLYQELTERGLLIPHKELADLGTTKIIEPEQVEFISYPYEWCFSMLKQAALNTLEINNIALRHGMILKDASAFNMQWHHGKMTLIDTLSFMDYEEGMPWGAYPQFLRHFLMPLLLMKYVNPSMVKLFLSNLDGIPVDVAVKLLPKRLMLRPSYLAHVYSQAMKLTVRGQRDVRMPKFALLSLLGTLESLITKLEYKPKSDWVKYGDEDSYTDGAFDSKKAIIGSFLQYGVSMREGVRNIFFGSDKTVCDLGTNIGFYVNMASLIGYKVIALDSDHDCIEMIDYRERLIFLVIDVCNPTPAIGWGNTERKSFLDRLHVDTIMALALIHHLCVGNNVPLAKVARMLSEHCRKLIIEFVPLEDPKAQLLLGKKNIPPYSYDIFKTEFGNYFQILREQPIEDSKRILFLMEVDGGR